MTIINQPQAGTTQLQGGTLSAGSYLGATAEISSPPEDELKECYDRVWPICDFSGGFSIFKSSAALNNRDNKTVTINRRTLMKWALSRSAALALPSNTRAHHTKPAQHADSAERQRYEDLIRHTAREAHSFNDEFSAAVWLVDMSRRLSRYVKNPNERLTILTTAHQEAKLQQLNPELVLSVMHVESLFDRFAISRVGAQGLMQIMPFWKQALNRPQDNLMDIKTNIYFGCRILRNYLNVEKGDYWRALARYNGSLGKDWYPQRVFRALDRFWYVKHT